MAGRLEGRLALITGASRGIGAAVAKKFALEGANLVLLARTQGALEEIDDAIRALGVPAPVLVPLDLREPDKIEQMGAALFERFGKLDILVGNAGVLGGLSPVGHYQPKNWDKVFETNVRANWRLIRSLEPLLRQSDAGRAVFVTSAVASNPLAYWGAYAASKAALESMVRCWAAELLKTELKVNLIDPGIVRTRLREEGFPGEDATKHPPPEAVTEAFVDLCTATCPRHGEIVRVVEEGLLSMGWQRGPVPVV